MQDLADSNAPHESTTKPHHVGVKSRNPDLWRRPLLLVSLCGLMILQVHQYLGGLTPGHLAPGVEGGKVEPPVRPLYSAMSALPWWSGLKVPHALW